MSVVLQVGELIAPLGNDAERIFQEGNDDQEPADGREVPVTPELSASGNQALLEHSRLDGLGEGVQPVLNLACLLSNGVQRAGVARGIGALGATERRLVSQVVSRGSWTADCQHSLARRRRDCGVVMRSYQVEGANAAWSGARGSNLLFGPFCRAGRRRSGRVKRERKRGRRYLYGGGGGEGEVRGRGHGCCVLRCSSRLGRGKPGTLGLGLI